MSQNNQGTFFLFIQNKFDFSEYIAVFSEFSYNFSFSIVINFFSQNFGIRDLKKF